ncbi:3-methyl-2-oxobutanoate hydroxymethyltransferase [Desulfothermus naphthae]
MTKSLTIPDIINSKGKRKLTMLTAYDYPTALIVDRCGIDMILVGDSLAMVVLGYKDTLAVTMDQMIHHTKAVTNAVNHAVVIGDMPFLSYQASVEQAVLNAGRFLKEAGAHAVKLEGGATVLPQIKAIINAGIPVQGHLGLTPQSAAQLGGFKVQGKTAEAAKKLLEDALILADAGCFSIVLEAIPAPIAEIITERCPVPTIGIGAGAGCDGQVLVFHDLVGLFDRFVPKFVKQYANISKEIEKAILKFKEEVESGKFPGKEHSFTMNKEELDKIK